MERNINDIIDYYAKANWSFVGIFLEQALPGKPGIHRKTNALYGGLAIPLAGMSHFTLNGTSYLMKPGIVVHAGPGMNLNIKGAGREPWRFAVIHYRIPINEIKRFPFFQSHFSFSTGENAKITDLIQQLLSQQSIPGALAAFQSKILFSNLLGEFFTLAKRQTVNDDTLQIEQIMDYIRQNYATLLTVSQIAERYEIDRRRLSYLFERHVGMSPIQYLIECRMRKAKELLHICECPVKQVAESVGYADSLYFSRAFKKQTGFSPSEYRESMRNRI